MRVSRRTARGCNPRCVYLRQRPRGLERPCLSRWLETGYAGPPLETSPRSPELYQGVGTSCEAAAAKLTCHGLALWPRRRRR
eukprot:6846521-Prymnesium_polylepis.1